MNGRHVADRRIVEEIAVGNLTIRSPFKHEKSGVQKILHDCYKSKDTSIRVRVRCGSDEFTEFQPCIVPNESAGRKQYMLRAIGDPNYAVGFCDRTEAECLALQGIGAVQPQGERNHHPYLSKKQILEFSHRNIPEQRESFKPPYLVYLYIFSTLTNKMAPALRRSSYHLSSYLLSLHFLSLWDFILSKLLYFEQDVNGGYGLALQVMR